MQLDLIALQQLIAKAFVNSENCHNKNLIPLIGATGDGKSTTLNYLSGIPLKKIKGKAHIADGSTHLAEIGHGAESCTLWPTAYPHQSKDGQSELAWCDCPGFFDNRPNEARLTVSLSTEKVIREAASIKGLLVVISYPTFTVGRGAGMREIAHVLSTLLKPSFKMDESILFLISKVPRDEDLEVSDVINEIKLLITAETNKLNDMKRQQAPSGSTHSHMPSFASYRKQLKDDGADTTSTLEDMSELQGKIDVLNLMLKLHNKIILLDVFDNGDCRNNILKEVSRFKPIPKETFDFSNADDVRVNFREIMTGHMAMAVKDARQLINLPSEIAKLLLQRDESTKDAKMTRSQLEDVLCGKVFQGEKDPIVIQHREIVRKNQTELNSLVGRKEALELELDECRKSLYRLDNDDLIEFKKITNKESRADHMARPFTNASGIVESSFTAVIVTIAAPLTFIDRLILPFKYDGAAFVEVEKICERGTFKDEKMDKANGKFMITYESDRGRDGQATVIIKGKRRNHPDNASKITALKSNQDEILTKQKNAIVRQNELRTANEKSQEIVQGFLLGEKYSLKDKERILRESIKNQEETILRLQRDIDTLERGYDFCLTSELPNSNLEADKLYLSHTGDYIVKSPAGKVEKGSLHNTEINLENLSSRLESDLTLKNDILNVTAKRGHTVQGFNNLQLTCQQKQPFFNTMAQVTSIMKFDTKEFPNVTTQFLTLCVPTQARPKAIAVTQSTLNNENSNVSNLTF